MQIWSPTDAIITDSKTDAEFRDLIKSQIGNIRSQRGMARKTKCKIVMPKFSMEYKDDIVDSLKAIGIEKVFSQTAADLSPMLGNRDEILWPTHISYNNYVSGQTRILFLAR